MTIELCPGVNESANDGGRCVIGAQGSGARPGPPGDWAVDWQGETPRGAKDAARVDGQEQCFK